MDRASFDGGKYTVFNDNGKLTALRHGEPWGRDLVGDNLVYWMLVEVLRLREALKYIATTRVTSDEGEAMAAYAKDVLKENA